MKCLAVTSSKRISYFLSFLFLSFYLFLVFVLLRSSVFFLHAGIMSTRELQYPLALHLPVKSVVLRSSPEAIQLVCCDLNDRCCHLPCLRVRSAMECAASRRRSKTPDMPSLRCFQESPLSQSHSLHLSSLPASCKCVHTHIYTHIQTLSPLHSGSHGWHSAGFYTRGIFYTFDDIGWPCLNHDFSMVRRRPLLFLYFFFIFLLFYAHRTKSW